VALYDKPVRLLMRDMVADMKLVPTQMLTRDEAVDWFRLHYPLVKEGTIAAHLIRLSTNNRNRLHYSAREDGADDLFFQLDSGRFRLYDAASDPTPIRLGTAPEEGVGRLPSSPESEEGSEFAYEHDLRDFLAQNLQLIEPGLRLYNDEGVRGIEFPVGGRYIDILAVDANGAYVVIELKVSRGYDRVIGQLLRYIAWIEAHHAEPGQLVRGVIVGKDISDDLKLACSKIADVKLFEYTLSVTLRAVK
jgi:endonuclease